MYVNDEVRELYNETMKEQCSVKNSARSYSKRRTGRVKLASDDLTKTQWESLNGEVKTYQLGKPMTWGQFDILPDDLKSMYIKRLRDKFGTSNMDIAEMLGVGIDKFVECLKSKKIPVGYARHYELNTEAWDSFINGDD